jgi:hypothetical protein
MTTTNQNVTIWAGNAVQLQIGITDATTGSGMVLSTASSIMWKLLKDAESVASPVLTKVTGGSGITVSGSTATVLLGETDTTSLLGNYYHMTKVRDTAGSPATVTVGTMTIRRSI